MAGYENGDWRLDLNNNMLSVSLPDDIGELKELEWLDARMETGDWT